ncbi:hypothetical protein CHCC20335_0640 [Bacillus paralicheniformis]|nr:hypothetical protein CHCC20335_0640 [Bacillus paralicheniformis]
MICLPGSKQSLLPFFIWKRRQLTHSYVLKGAQEEMSFKTFQVKQKG